MMHSLLEVTFTGDVDDAELDELRARLGMASHGRLSDDWDDEFGRRELRPPDSGWIYLILTRDLDREGWWKVALKFEQTPLPATEVDMWEQKITSAIKAARQARRKLARPWGRVCLPVAKVMTGSSYIATSPSVPKP